MQLDLLDLDADGFHRLIESLRYDFHKWDAWLGGRLRVLPEALLLERDEFTRAVDLAESVSAALARVADAVRADARARGQLQIPASLQALIDAERAWPFQLARYDLIPTAQGWMLPEFNEDAPGGYNESIAGNALFAPVLRRGRVAGDLAEAFLGAVPREPRCALVYASGYAEDLQHMLVLADQLRARGYQPLLASPDQLRCGWLGRPRVQGQPVDWIFRFFPAEWFPVLSNLDDWRRAVTRVPVLNPLARAFRQSKCLYALWNALPGIDEADRRLLQSCTPQTEWFMPERVEALRGERCNWVLKQPFGRMGDAVLIGRHLSEPAWNEALKRAATRPQEWLLQRAFEPLGLPSSVQQRQFPALGLYLVNGRFAGCYSRADEIGFTTHEAHYVVTAVLDS